MKVVNYGDPKDVKLSFRVSNRQFHFINQFCENNRISVSGYFCMLIEKHICGGFNENTKSCCNDKLQ